MSGKERPTVLKLPELSCNTEPTRATQTRSNMTSRAAPEINISSDEEEVSAVKRGTGSEEGRVCGEVEASQALRST